MEPMQTKSKHTGLIIGIIVILVIVLGLVLWGKHKPAIDDDTMMPPSDSGAQSTTTSPTDSGTGAVANPDREGTSVGSGAGKYATLMLTYKGRMVQFNGECQVITRVQGFKQGTDVLLDNRGTKSAKIVIGSRTFILPAYGYKVVDMPTIGTFVVDCNARQNVTTITVQK